MNEIQTLRSSTGLSQAEFATLVGISKATLAGWEQNRRKPPGYLITWLEAYLKTKGYLN